MKLTASAANGKACPAPKSTAPSSGPTIELPTSTLPCSQEFARSSPSVVTTDGRIALAALSRNRPPELSRKATAARSSTALAPDNKASAKSPRTSVRAPSTIHIMRRRSSRSTKTPASRPKATQGRYSPTLTSAICRGSAVIVAASSGNAAKEMPSP
jgi:hypothetical protein